MTGCAGFIGFHTCLNLLNKGYKVIGVDNFSNYYDPSLKENRVNILLENQNFHLERGNIIDKHFLTSVFNRYIPTKVCHLAAQPGVQASIEEPYKTMDNNLNGFLNVLEVMKEKNVNSIVFASSSSVYGNTQGSPSVETDITNLPLTLYASTKIMNELMAYNYHRLFGFKCIGLRFFTVYGDFGRPDMALFTIAKNILENKVVNLHNTGNIKRDFTFIDDITDGIYCTIESTFDYEIFNLGSGQQTNLADFVKIIETKIGKKAKKKYFPAILGDVLSTASDISKAKKMLNYCPKTSLKDGIHKSLTWYLNNL